jgi:hypothetical protein
MLEFYGFQGVSSGESIEISTVSNFPHASRHWFTRFDHNHLRITRIIRSLRVLGLEQNARAFFRALSSVNDQFKGRLSIRSVDYWRRAALRSLHIAPDVDDDDATTGEYFLLEFETNQAAKLSSGHPNTRGEVLEETPHTAATEQRTEQAGGEPTEEEVLKATACPVPE